MSTAGSRAQQEMANTTHLVKVRIPNDAGWRSGGACNTAVSRQEPILARDLAGAVSMCKLTGCQLSIQRG